jgi:hypothetical protein
MRQPTPAKDLYAWHTGILSGDPDTQTHGDWPECGWFRTKLVKGGPWVAVEIRIIRGIDTDTGELAYPETLGGTINGNPLSQDEILKLWTWIKPISRDAYKALLKLISATPSMHDPYQILNPIKDGAKR